MCANVAHDENNQGKPEQFGLVVGLDRRTAYLTRLSLHFMIEAWQDALCVVAAWLRLREVVARSFVLVVVA